MPNFDNLPFHKNVIKFALIIIIIISILYVIVFSMTSNNIKYPPIIANCPDYWEANNDLCINIHNLGEGCDKRKNFNIDKYKGISGLKQKCKWAKTCGIEWDGVTNNNLC